MRTTSSSLSTNFLRVAISSAPYPCVISSVNRFHVLFFHGPGTYFTRMSALKSLTSRRFPPRSHTSVGHCHVWLFASKAAREAARASSRSEEHTSELQSRENLVCRLLL